MAGGELYLYCSTVNPIKEKQRSFRAYSLPSRPTHTLPATPPGDLAPLKPSVCSPSVHTLSSNHMCSHESTTSHRSARWLLHYIVSMARFECSDVARMAKRDCAIERWLTDARSMNRAVDRVGGSVRCREGHPPAHRAWQVLSRVDCSSQSRALHSFVLIPHTVGTQRSARS